MDKKGTILYAEDNLILRELLTAYINNVCETARVIAETPSSFDELLSLIEKQIPDLLLLNLGISNLNVEKLEIITKKYPTIKTIVLDQNTHDRLKIYKLLKGACAFVSKNNSLQQIIEIIQKVFKDGLYFDGMISRKNLNEMIKIRGDLYSETEIILSIREVEVLYWISNGDQYKQIADKLGVSIDTIKFHLKNIRRKTHLNTTAALVKYAIRIGITAT